MQQPWHLAFAEAVNLKFRKKRTGDKLSRLTERIKTMAEERRNADGGTMDVNGCKSMAQHRETPDADPYEACLRL